MEVIFEFKQIGAIMKVVAVDAETGMEVSIQGPANLGQALLQKNALAKLKYVLKKQKEGQR